MFRPFLDALRRHGVPVSLREWLDLMGAMQAGVAGWSVDDFHTLGRAVLVKDERHIDRYDRAFAESFAGLETIPVEALVRLGRRADPDRRADAAAVAEAMAARCPFVVSDAGALPEVAGPGYPFVAARDDAGSLAAVIEDALSEPTEDVVDRAQQRWHVKYSPEGGRERLHQLLIDILRKGDGKS